MKTKDVLELDCRIPENEEVIQKVLRQIKPLAKCSEEKDISFEKLEKCMKVLCVRYQIFPRQISPDPFVSDDDVIWRFEAVDIKNLKVVVRCYGRNLYEVLAKAVIAIYAMTRKKR